MSALAGIFKTDRRNRVESQELLRLAGEDDRFGPDRGGDYSSGNIGMSHRALFTTPGSPFRGATVDSSKFYSHVDRTPGQPRRDSLGFRASFPIRRQIQS